jgi:hypothetical protein
MLYVGRPSGHRVPGPAQRVRRNKQLACSPLRSLHLSTLYCTHNNIAPCDRNFPSPRSSQLHRVVRMFHSASLPLLAPAALPSRVTPCSPPHRAPSPSELPSTAAPHSISPVTGTACTVPPPPPRHHQEKVSVSGDIVSRS